MYIVIYDYNCNGRNFTNGTIINSNNFSKEEIKYLLSIGVIKHFENSNIKEKENKIDEIKRIKKESENKVEEEIKEIKEESKNDITKKKIKVKNKKVK